ncbi:MAG: acyl-ACP desaturase [Candidatus Binataceae bacterium]|nr:acyl-ACP desaturase [Candidatus Binataceae bacterium]
MAVAMREKTYRLYLDYLETAETKRRWNIFNDIPWDEFDLAKTTPATAASVEIFCAEEMYLPDYSINGLALVRDSFGPAWFQAAWAFEESRHGLVFREYLTRSGLRTEAEFAILEAEIVAKVWKLPFATTRQMACYGALQEGATFVAYRAQREQARAAGDTVREAIFHLVGRDEAAHGGFYRSMVELELAEDRAGTVDDLAFVLANFKMPGDGLIADYHARLQATGAGISPRVFMQRVVLPLLTTLGTTRDELRLAQMRLRPAA